MSHEKKAIFNSSYLRAREYGLLPVECENIYVGKKVKIECIDNLQLTFVLKILITKT